MNNKRYLKTEIDSVLTVIYQNKSDQNNYMS